MAANQTILMTAIPRGVAVDTELLPVSVFVSPRLRGADRLDAFPDWLSWTMRVKENGLTLRFRCAGELFDVAVEQADLDPAFWEALFKADTLVHSHEFDDYSDRPVLSFPVRDTLSALKSIYQEAGVHLALPDGPEGPGDRELTNRQILEHLVDGLAVHWRDDRGAAERRKHAVTKDHLRSGRTDHVGELDSEGLVPTPPQPGRNEALAGPFSTFHNMPTPKGQPGPEGEPQERPALDPDWNTLLDFHRALASLNAYPELQLRLGIVFEVSLPADFVRHEPGDPFTSLSVATVIPGWDWSVGTELPEVATACVHLHVPGGNVFTTAPRILGQKVETGVPHVPPAPILGGLLHLDPRHFGLAQVDVDGGMHKAIMLAESRDPDPDQYLGPSSGPAPAPHPEVFDPEATLPSLRSGGFSLYADERALHLLTTVLQAKEFNEAVESGGEQPRPFFAEDLVRGYRLDVWDSSTQELALAPRPRRDLLRRHRGRPTRTPGGRGGGVRPARRDAAGAGCGARDRGPLPARGNRALGGLEPRGRDARPAHQR